MFFVMRKRHIALFLSAASCLVILAAIWWESGLPEAAETMGNGPSAAPARVIVIDAGHGGADGGAVADDGTTEAEINLAVAKKLEAVFDLLGCETVMVRQEDVSIHSDGVEGLRNQKVSDIHNRLAVAEDHPEAIYISIHQNKYTSASIWGAQVFYGTKNDGSEELARLIQQTIRTELQPDNKREIKPAEKNLYILSHAKCPAVLVECGFLSNSEECQKLESDSYQQELAFCILTSTMEYIYGGGNAPEGN